MVQIKPAKRKPGKSLYARVTDTGIDLKEAAKRLNIEWDTAAEIDDADFKDESDVHSVVVNLFPWLSHDKLVFLIIFSQLPD
ncbi:hypothetical protein RchiOBHm_Chr5g0021881 [Rosa chinensis]|uniref:Uncharacterized protein n=1 Tax=Rosa chinensis TaxID=74649 RepID=A0A2P6Q7N8_ROSCH|nr:hypothetical protein RchiOBHm_Chr5g0021881 [Rosa chinensis]